MNLRKQIAWLMGATLGIMVMMVSMGTAHASFQMRFRANWKVNYWDGDMGDYLVSNGEVTVPAGYVWYSVFTGTGSTLVESGVLSSSGYTGYFTANNNQNYWLQLTTIIERDGRMLIIEAPVNATTCRTTDGPLGYYYASVRPSGVPNNTYKTVSRLFNVPFLAGIGRVAAQAFLRADLMKVPDGEQWRMRTATDFNAAQYILNDRFCFAYGVPTHKYIIAHEFAHAMADHDSHIISGWPDPPNLSNPECYCPGGLYGHCLTMWLNIDAAQSEAFAEFGATAILNSRSSASPELGYNVPYSSVSLPSWLPSNDRRRSLQRRHEFPIQVHGERLQLALARRPRHRMGLDDLLLADLDHRSE